MRKGGSVVGGGKGGGRRKVVDGRGGIGKLGRMLGEYVGWEEGRGCYVHECVYAHVFACVCACMRVRLYT